MIPVMVSVQGVPTTIARYARAMIIGEQAADVAADDLAANIATIARSLAPVETGALLDSIGTDEAGVVVGVDYAQFVEYGTSDTSPSPFVRPAMDESRTYVSPTALAMLRKL